VNADRNTPHGTKIVIRGYKGELFPAWFIAPSRTAPDTRCLVEFVDDTGWIDPWDEVTYDQVFIEEWEEE
jgi:hypothetical protein